MKKKRNKLFFKFSICILLLSIVIPLIILGLWSIAGKWKYPGILPQNFSTRGLEEVIFGNKDIIGVLLTSNIIALTVGILATIIGIMTARAIVHYNLKIKETIRVLNFLPLMISATAFAMGVHVYFIRLGLSDNVFGVIIIHLICALPYSVLIITDITEAVGKKLEEQAMVLGASFTTAFFRVSFKALAPGLMTSFFMAYIVSFSQYFLTLIIGGGNVKTLSIVMVPFIQSGDRTIAAAYSIVFILSLLFAFLAIEIINKKFITNKQVELFR